MFNLFKKTEAEVQAKNEKGMIDRILRDEGGFVDDYLDAGGATNRGITARTYSDYLGIRQDEVTIRMMKDIDEATARDIYIKNYYERFNINDLPEPFQAAVMDFSVNSGNVARELFQKTLNAHRGAKLAVDGIIGPLTSSAAREAAEEGLTGRILDEYCDERISFLNNCVRSGGIHSKFIGGLTARAERYRNG